MNIIKIYTDGSCSPNPGSGGWGAIIIVEDSIIELSGFSENTTNNKMEITAVIRSLEFVKSKYGQKCSIVLYTDSRYVQQGISSWIAQWKKNGWRKASSSKVKNVEFWMSLDELANCFDNKVEFVHVMGHRDNFGNIKADELAGSAMLKKSSEIVVRQIKKDEKW